LTHPVARDRRLPSDRASRAPLPFAVAAPPPASLRRSSVYDKAPAQSASARRYTLSTRPHWAGSVDDVPFCPCIVFRPGRYATPSALTMCSRPPPPSVTQNAAPRGAVRPAPSLTRPVSTPCVRHYAVRPALPAAVTCPQPTHTHDATTTPPSTSPLHRGSTAAGRPPEPLVPCKTWRQPRIKRAAPRRPHAAAAYCSRPACNAARHVTPRVDSRRRRGALVAPTS
jgi:hypothetical protein